MLKRFATLEALILLVAGLLAVFGGLRIAGVARAWAVGGAVGWFVLGYSPMLIRLQDRLLEYYIATGRFPRALALAAVIRDSAPKRKLRDLGDFDLGLVHLARGAPADAIRTFGRIEKHLHKEPIRQLVVVYEGLSRMRSNPAAEREEPARETLRAVKEATTTFGEDATLLGIEGEALLTLGDGEAAYARLRRSIELDGDPRDPSPGERHLHLGRAAAATGRTKEARLALEIAITQAVDTPFVNAAREELARLAA